MASRAWLAEASTGCKSTRSSSRPSPVTVKIQLQDEAGFDVFTRRTINASAGWGTISVAVPGGFDKSLAGHGNPAGFDWHRVSLCSLIVERVNVGDGIINPDSGRFLMQTCN